MSKHISGSHFGNLKSFSILLKKYAFTSELLCISDLTLFSQLLVGKAMVPDIVFRGYWLLVVGGMLARNCANPARQSIIPRHVMFTFHF